jgi:four helix bundle protein
METLKTQSRSFGKSQFNAAPAAGGEKKYKTYQDLQIWKRGIDLVDMVYSNTERFPKEDAEALGAQMRRSAVLIPSEIAEGYVRRYAGEYVQFLYGALGACARLNTQLFISAKRRYLDSKSIQSLAEIISEETGMLINLIKVIQRGNGSSDKHSEQAKRF